MDLKEAKRIFQAYTLDMCLREHIEGFSRAKVQLKLESASF